MVTGLQLPIKSLPLDGMLMKSQAQDSEALPSLSFGEILKAKEKQMRHEQEMSSALAAVVLTVVQTSFVTLPPLSLDVDESLYRADIQPALRKGLPLSSSSGPSFVQSPSQVNRNLPTKTAEPPIEERRATFPDTTSKPSASQPDGKAETLLLDEVVQAPNTYIKLTASQSYSLPDVLAGDHVLQTNVETNVSDAWHSTLSEDPPSEAQTPMTAKTKDLSSKTGLDQAASPSSSEFTAATAGAQNSYSEAAGMRVNPPSVEVDSSFTPFTATEEAPGWQVATNQNKDAADNSINDVSQASVQDTRVNEGFISDASTSSPFLDTKVSADTLTKPDVGKANTQPVVSSKQHAFSQNTADVENPNPLSPPQEDMVEVTESANSRVAKTLETVYSHTNIETGRLEDTAQRQPLSETTSIGSSATPATVPLESKAGTVHTTLDAQQSIEVHRQIGALEGSDVVEMKQTSFTLGKTNDPAVKDMPAEERYLRKQETPPSQKAIPHSSHPVTSSDVRSESINQDVMGFETKVTTLGEGADALEGNQENAHRHSYTVTNVEGVPQHVAENVKPRDNQINIPNVAGPIDTVDRPRDINLQAVNLNSSVQVDENRQGIDPITFGTEVTISFVGNSHANFGSPDTVDDLQGSETTQGTEVRKNQGTLLAEEISISVNQPDVHSSQIGKENRLHLATSQTQSERHQLKVKGTSEEASDSQVESTVIDNPFAEQAITFTPMSDSQHDQNFVGKKTASFGEGLTLPSKNLQAGESQGHGIDIGDDNRAGKDIGVFHQTWGTIKNLQTKVSPSEPDGQLSRGGVGQELVFFEGEYIESTSFAPISDSPKAKENGMTNTVVHEDPSTIIKPVSPEITLFSENETIVDTSGIFPQPMQNQVDSGEAIPEVSQTFPDLPVSFSVEPTVPGMMPHTQVAAEDMSHSITDPHVSKKAQLQTGIDSETFITDAGSTDTPSLTASTLTKNSNTAFNVSDVDVASHKNPEIEPGFPESLTEVQVASSNAHKDQIRRMVGTVQEVAATSFANESYSKLHLENAQRTVVEDRWSGMFQQIKPETPLAGMTVQEAAAGVANHFDAQPIAQSMSPVFSDDGALPSMQPGMSAARQVVDGPYIEQKIIVGQPEDNSHSASPIRFDESDPVETQAAGISNASQSTSSIDADLNSAKGLPYQVAVSSLEIPAGNSEKMEKQPGLRSTVASQITGKLPEESEASSTTRVDSEISDQTLDSASRNFGNRQTSFQGALKTIVEQVSPPISSDENQDAAVSMKNDSSKQGSDIEPTQTINRELSPVENEFEPNGFVESASTGANVQREIMSVGSLEKGSTFPINPHAVEVVQQVIRQLNGKLKSGFTSMRLQLNPDSLGAIEVEVVKDVQGVRVTFFAEQSSTGRLLETQLTQLRQSLVDSGVQLSTVNISQQSYSRQEGGFQHQNKNFAQTSHREDFQRDINAQESPRVERGTWQTSEVDYLI